MCGVVSRGGGGICRDYIPLCGVVRRGGGVFLTTCSYYLFMKNCYEYFILFCAITSMESLRLCYDTMD